MRQTQLDEFLLKGMKSQAIISMLEHIAGLNQLKPFLWKELDRRRQQYIDSLGCSGDE